MQVFEVKDGMAVQANYAHVIPPNKSMVIQGGPLHLTISICHAGGAFPSTASSVRWQRSRASG